MRSKYTSFVLTLSAIVFLLPATPALAVEKFSPGQTYSVNESFDCVDNYTYTYSATITVLSGDIEEMSDSLYVDASEDEFGDCTSVNVTGSIQLPDTSGFYSVVVSLVYDGSEVGARSYDIEIGELGDTEASISSLTWMPGVEVDIKQAPEVKFAFRRQDGDGGYLEEYCPASVKLQYSPSGSSWRNVKIIKKDDMTCAAGRTKGNQTLTFQTPGAGRIRVLVDGQPTKSKKIKIVKPQNKFRFLYFWSNKKKVHWIGDKVYVGAYLEQKLQNGVWVNLKRYKHKVRVQKLSGGTWVPAGSCSHWIESQWTWTGCGPVENRPGLKVRMILGNAIAIASGFEAKTVRFSGIYLQNGWPSCYYLDGMTLKVGTKGTNGKEWSKPVKIILQHRVSRFDSWENIDYDYSTKTHWATLHYSNCYVGGYFRLYAPTQGKYLESGFYS